MTPARGAQPRALSAAVPSAVDRAGSSAAAPANPQRRDALRSAGRGAMAALGLARPWPSKAQAQPRHVLIVHSFGRDFAPYDAVAQSFRRELASLSAEPVVFLETSLDAGRPVNAGEERAFVAYLKTRFEQPQPDLIVGIGPLAGQLLMRHRAALFPQVPVLITALDAREVPRALLRPGDMLVPTRLDLPGIVGAFLRVRPETQSIAVIFGNSDIERFWRRQVERDTAVHAGRVEFIWLDGLSLQQMKARVAALPPNSAVFFALLIVDAAGIPHERLDALAELKQAASVPVFSAFETEIGRGVLGGPHLSQSRMGREVARLALHSLSGAHAPEPLLKTIELDAPAYDGRELARWHIDESLLPPGSEVRFRETPLWVRFRWEIAAASLVFAAQAALIGALLVQRARRQRAEREARALGGRLITAYEDEGRRLARELHDDITQRLAGVSIEAAMLGRHADAAERRAAEESIAGELAGLSRDVHALSYRLHPSVVDDLGLGEALRIECERAARRSSAAIDLDADEAGRALRGEMALCLFRVAVSALRNALRHGQPKHVRVELRGEAGGARVSVVDDGCGFDPEAPRERASIGLASMRERVALLGGRLEIRSRPGEGTSVTAWVPAARATP